MTSDRPAWGTPTPTDPDEDRHVADEAFSRGYPVPTRLQDKVRRAVRARRVIRPGRLTAEAAPSLPGWFRTGAALVAGAGVVTGAGFGIAALIPDPIHQGTVISRDYDDPDHWTTLEPIYGIETCVTTGSGTSASRICNRPIIGFYNRDHYDGPHWNLKLQADADGRTGWREVDESTYAAHPLGAHFDDGYREEGK